MKLKEPFKVTPGLYPGLRIDDAWLECREALQFVIHFDDGHEHYVEGFRPGAFADLQDCFEAILGFLGAWAEALNYGEESDNYDLFDPEDQKLVEWAQSNSDEFSLIECELMESEDLIEC